MDGGLQRGRAREGVYWRDAFAWTASVTPVVLPRIVWAGAFGLGVGILHEEFVWDGLGVVPVQYTGAVLVLLLVFRTNASYDRWWEARKLWGGIVNQTRNLGLAALAYGPDDAAWRGKILRSTAAFPYACRDALRGTGGGEDLARLISPEAAGRAGRLPHTPSVIAARIAWLLRQAYDQGTLSPWAFFAAEQERAALINHLGGCERILRTPLPHVHTIKVRRFVVLYLLWLPFAAVGDDWWMPGLLTAAVAYPLFAIDEIAVELQNPFATTHLSHLPLDQICSTIERQLLALPLADPRNEPLAWDPAIVELTPPPTAFGGAGEPLPPAG